MTDEQRDEILEYVKNVRKELCEIVVNVKERDKVSNPIIMGCIDYVINTSCNMYQDIDYTYTEKPK